MQGRKGYFVSMTLLPLLVLSAGADPGVTLTVEVSGAADDRGVVLCQLFRSPDGFPDDDPKASAYSAAVLRGGRGTCVFLAQPPGRVSVAAFHDADGDAKLARNLFGLPAEGYGFSNGAQAGMLGPPAWEDAAVTIGARPVTFPLVVTR